MQELKSLVDKAMSDVDIDGIVTKAVQENVEKAVKSAVESNLRSYSDFGKGLEEAIKKAMTFDFDQIKLPEYQDFVVTAINNALIEYMNKDHAKELMDRIHMDVVGENRDSIKAHVFFETVVEMIKEGSFDDPCNCSGEEYELRLERKVEDYRYSTSLASWEIKLTEEGKDYPVFVASIFRDDGHIYYVRDGDSVSREFNRINTWFRALRYRKTKITGLEEMSFSFPGDLYDH